MAASYGWADASLDMDVSTIFSKTVLVTNSGDKELLGV